MKINFNPNAAASRIIENEFNGCVSSGIAVYIAAADKDSVTLAKWQFGEALPKAFTLLQRTPGSGCVCAGGYLKQEYIEGHELLGKKCFIKVGGTMRNRTITIRLDTAAKRMPNRDVAMISFDPQYSEE